MLVTISRFLKNKLFKESTFGLATMLIVALANFLYFLILAKFLSVESYGKIVYYISISNLISILLPFGIDIYMRSEVGKYSDEERSTNIVRTHKALLICIVIAALPVAVIVYYSIKVPSILQSIKIMGLIVVYSWCRINVVYFQNIFYGMHRLRYPMVINSLYALLRVLSALVSVLYFRSIFEILISISFIEVIILIVSVYQVNIIYNLDFKEYFNVKIKTNDIMYVIKGAKWIYIVFIGFKISTEMDTIMIGLLSDDTQVAYYGVAKQFAKNIPIIATGLCAGIAPIYANGKYGNKMKLDLFRKVTFGISLLYILILLILSFVIEPLIMILYKPEYLLSAKVFILLTPYILFLAVFTFMDQVLNFSGKSRLKVTPMLISIIINFVLNYFLIPMYGAIGASISTSVSFVPNVLLNYHSIIKLYKPNTIKIKRGHL